MAGRRNRAADASSAAAVLRQYAAAGTVGNGRHFAMEEGASLHTHAEHKPAV
jgi:hypothetical protein